jgi:hypothetical protein
VAVPILLGSTTLALDAPLACLSKRAAAVASGAGRRRTGGAWRGAREPCRAGVGLSRAFLIGGETASGAVTSTVEVLGLDFLTNAWSAGPSLGIARKSAAAVVWLGVWRSLVLHAAKVSVTRGMTSAGRLWAIGGDRSNTTSTITATTSVEYLNLSDPAAVWVASPGLALSRSGPAVTPTTFGYLFLAGGSQSTPGRAIQYMTNSSFAWTLLGAASNMIGVRVSAALFFSAG